MSDHPANPADSHLSAKSRRRRSKPMRKARGPPKGVESSGGETTPPVKIHTLAVAKQEARDPSSRGKARTPAGSVSTAGEPEDRHEDEDAKSVVAGPEAGAGEVTTIRERIKARGVYLEFTRHVTGLDGKPLPIEDRLNHVPFTDLSVVCGKASKVNPHEISAAYRRLAEVSVLRDLGEATTAKIVDVWGSARFASMCKKYGVEHVNGGFGVNYYNDAAKGPRQVLEFGTVWGTHALIEDVYHVTPTELKWALDHTSQHVCYVIVRRFVGALGADEDAEMCWRRENGLIVAYPDVLNPPYPPHPDTEWLFQGIEGMLVTILVRSGPYYVLKIVPSDVPPVLNPVVPGAVEERKICTSMYGAFISDLVQLFGGRWRPRNRVVLVDAVVERQLRVTAYTRPLTGSTQTDLRVAVENSIKRQPWAQRFLEHPTLQAYYHEVVEGTWLSLMDTAPDYARQMYAMRANQGPEEAMTRAARAHHPPVYDALYKRVLKVAFSVVKPVATYASYVIVIVGTPMILSRACQKFGLHVLRTLKHSLPGCLFPRTPLLSFILENVAYVAHRDTAVVVGTVEFARDGANSAFLMHYVKTLLGHSGKWGVLAGVGLHALWNLRVGKPAERLSINMDEVRQQVVNGDRSPGDPGVFPVSLGENYLVPFLPPPPEWTPNTVGTVRVSCPDGTSIVVKDASSLSKAWVVCSRMAKERRITNKFVSVVQMSPSSTVFPVDNNAATTLVAIVSRLMARPHVKDGQVADFPWWRVCIPVIKHTNLWPRDRELNYRVDEFLLQTNTITRTRLENGFLALQEDGYVPRAQSVFVKSDETLAKPRPRAVVSVDPTDQTQLVAAAQALKTIFKEFCPRIWDFGGKQIHVWYCSSMTGIELNTMREMLEDVEYAIVVAGDDSLIIYEYQWFCNDFSKFDGSRSESSIVFAMTMWDLMGIPEKAQVAMARLTNYRYRAQSEGFTFEGSVDHMFPTGATTTTIGNGGDNINCMACGFAAGISAKLPATEMFARIGTDLGFVLKVRATPELWQVDFLKGWWVPTREGLQWINLPSMVLKASKVGTEPSHIFRKVTSMPDLAFGHLVFTIAQSWKGIPREYPIFGAYLSVCDRMGIPLHNPGSYRNAVVENAEYKAWANIRDLDVSEVVAMIAKRYGVDEDQVIELDTMIRGISTLPCYLSHPVLDRLLQVDYL